MKLERISDNKIKFSISVEELEQKGLFDHDQWKDSLMWHDLFEDILDEVQGKFGIENQMEMTVEIESFDEQEICMILTLENDDDFSDWDEGIVSVPPKKEHDILISFNNIDDVIQLVKRIQNLTCIKQDTLEVSLYYYKKEYSLLFENIQDKERLAIEALSYEYGNPAVYSKHLLLEYGLHILKEDTIEKILFYF